jgi:hypothetical protein
MPSLSPPQYGSPSYWDQRYTAQPVPFDWYQGYQGLAELLTQHIPTSSHVLHVSGMRALTTCAREGRGGGVQAAGAATEAAVMPRGRCCCRPPKMAPCNVLSSSSSWAWLADNAQFVLALRVCICVHDLLANAPPPCSLRPTPRWVQGCPS